jgi:hypothetical protein
MIRGDVLTHNLREHDACDTGFGNRDRVEERQLFTIKRPPALNRHRCQQRELEISAAARLVFVHALRLESCSLEAAESVAELFVCATIDAPVHGAQERVKGERDGSIFRFPGFVKSPQQLDVDILVERAGQAIARARQHTPSVPLFVGE